MTERWKPEDCQECCFWSPIAFDVESGEGKLGCQITNSLENNIPDCLRGGPFTRLRQAVGKGYLRQEKPALTLVSSNKAS